MSINCYYPEPKPLVIINFDINGTIVSSDTVAKTTPEGRISWELAKVFVRKWDEQTEPMSFEKYANTVLHPNDMEAAKNTKETFLRWLDQTAHPARDEVFCEYEKIREVFTDPESGKIDLEQLYPSFVYALEQLAQQDVDYRICLRTFGFDLEKVVDKIHNSSLGNDLNIHFINRGAFDGKDETSKNSFVFNNQRLEDIHEIFNALVHSKGHSAIQDNYWRWKNNQEQACFGKPFLFPKAHFWENRTVICLMFDDCGYSIVSPVEVTTGKESRPEDTPSVFVVNTFEAMTKKAYFWEKILETIKSANPAYASQIESVPTES